MSNQDTFVDEVNEELRRDRMVKAAKKYGWIAVLFVVGIVGGSAYSEWQKSAQISSNQAYGDHILAALSIEDADKQAAAVGEIPLNGRAPFTTQLIEAAGYSNSGKNSKAADLYKQVIAANETPAPYKQLASLRLVLLPDDVVTSEEKIKLLDLLKNPGSAYRPLALEQSALIAIKQNNTDQAISEFTAILEDPATSRSIYTRVEQMILSLGGSLPETAALKVETQTVTDENGSAQ